MHLQKMPMVVFRTIDRATTRLAPIQTRPAEILKVPVNGQPELIQFDNHTSQISHTIVQRYHERLLEHDRIKAKLFNETLCVSSIHKTRKRSTNRLRPNNRRLFCAIVLALVSPGISFVNT